MVTIGAVLLIIAIFKDFTMDKSSNSDDVFFSALPKHCKEYDQVLNKNIYDFQVLKLDKLSELSEFNEVERDEIFKNLNLDKSAYSGPFTDRQLEEIIEIISCSAETGFLKALAVITPLNSMAYNLLFSS